jgi:hypothetical protein
MTKLIKFEKSSWGLSASMILFGRICFYAGRTDHWGISAEANLYDRSITFEILNLYAGVEFWRK